MASNNTKMQFTKANWESANEKVKASSYTIMEESTKESGLMIRDMAQATRDSSMVTFTKGSLSTEKLTGKDCLHGPMEKYMMVNGSAELKRDMEFGEAKMVIRI